MTTLTDYSTIDPEWVGVIGITGCVVLLLLLGGIERRRTVREREAKARADWEARQRATRANAVPFNERCGIPSCGKRKTSAPHGWNRCDDHAHVGTRVGGVA